MIFRWRRLVAEMLDQMDLQLIGLRVQADRADRKLGWIMGNQQVLDDYAAAIVEQNAQIRAAVEGIQAEIATLTAAAQAVSVPLDTAQMDAALAALTGAVDAVEALPVPVVEEVVEVAVEVPVEEPVVEVPVEEPVEVPVEVAVEVPVETLPDESVSDGGEPAV